MRARLSQKLLPLTLCFAAGVGLSAAAGFIRREKPRDEQLMSSAEAHSRSWLVIKSRPTSPLFLFSSRDIPALRAVQFRAVFGGDGKVSRTALLTGSLPDELVLQMTEATKRISFIPATEDSRPLAVTADVTYEIDALCACGNDVLDDGVCSGGYVVFPTNISVSIISVESSKESEGWRVVYE